MFTYTHELACDIIIWGGDRIATKAHLEGNKRYLAKLDRGVFYVPKGDIEKIKQQADKLGKSVNKYIVDLIEADMQKDQG